MYAQQLPQKYDKVVFCPLSHLQIDVYKRILATDEVSNLMHKDEKCDCGSGDKYAVVIVSLIVLLSQKLHVVCRRGKCCHQVDPATLFRTIALLIRISNHLALIIPCKVSSEYASSFY
jgi:DNA excision repair protein ERCC-6-like 2